MNKKRDKKKFKRKNIKISNIELGDVDQFTDDVINVLNDSYAQHQESMRV